MTDPPDPENDEPKMSGDEVPPEPSAYNPVSHVESQQTQDSVESSDRPRSSAAGLMIFLGGFAFVALVVVGGYIYLLRPQPSHFRFSDEEGLAPSPSASPTPMRAATPPFTGVSLKSDLPITADMLRVTSIALGNTPLVIVNGKRLAEGEWLKIKVGNDFAAVQVAKIEDGVVHFAYGNKTIDSKLIVSSSTQKKPH